MNVDLFALFEQLVGPTDGFALSALQIPGMSHFRVARDSSGNCAILIRVEETSTARSVRLRHFEFDPQVRATVSDAATQISVTCDFAVLRCVNADAPLQRRFFDVAAGMLDSLGSQPTIEEIDRNVRSIAEIFRAMHLPSTGSITGLWAELLMIADAKDPQRAAACWHDDPNELFDFYWASSALEVKATVAHSRIHEISLDQLPGYGGLVASFMLDSSPTGHSVSDLLRMATDRLPKGTETAKRLVAIVAQTIGEQWRDLDDSRFDLEKARESLRVFDAARIPTVDRSLPPEVSHVRFRVDLSNVVPVRLDELESQLVSVFFSR